jgi:exosome complex RNA-binding protein Rrp4
MLEDMVIGVIKARGEYYRVDIGAHQLAQLHCLSFDGATKRNRPNLKVGDMLYCRVVNADRHLEAPELSCMSAKGPKKDWVYAQESIFGQLRGGYAFECSPVLCRRLLDPHCPLLRHLGELFAFEIAVGMNGKVWVSATGSGGPTASASQAVTTTSAAAEGDQTIVAHTQTIGKSQSPLDAFETVVLVANTIKNSERLGMQQQDDDKAMQKFVHDSAKQYISNKRAAAAGK